MKGTCTLLVAVVGVQVAYPLTGGAPRTAVIVSAVLLGAALAVTHALSTRGRLWTARFCLVVIGGSALVEAVGVATGWPFGAYRYAGGLGPHVAGVPVVVPLAWAMMAYPAWLAAARLAAGGAGRVLVAGWALASWDLFLDPQMVAAGRWAWRHAEPALPGVPGIPLGNYAGWLAVSVVLMAAVATAAGPVPATTAEDLPMLGFYLWTYLGSVVAHAVFLDLPGSALWGGIAMGLVAVPLAIGLAHQRWPTVRHRRASLAAETAPGLRGGAPTGPSLPPARTRSRRWRQGAFDLWEAGRVKRAAPRPVLITNAEPSQDDQLRRRQIRYVAMMSVRAVCVVLAAVLVSLQVPLLWLWLTLCGLGMVLLPWFAVILANDRPPKEQYRLRRHHHPEPAPPHALPPPRPEDRVIEPEP